MSPPFSDVPPFCTDSSFIYLQEIKMDYVFTYAARFHLFKYTYTHWRSSEISKFFFTPLHLGNLQSHYIIIIVIINFYYCLHFICVIVFILPFIFHTILFFIPLGRGLSTASHQIPLSVQRSNDRRRPFTSLRRPFPFFLFQTKALFISVARDTVGLHLSACLSRILTF